jgi:hypothetical protein
MDHHIAFPTTHHAQVVDIIKRTFGNLHVVGIEIGTLGADLTKTILRECPYVRLYTVDPWTHDDKNLFEAGHPQAEHDQMKAHAYNALKEYGDRITIMPITSDEAFLEIFEKVDFVWIDGDHMIDAVERDIENAKKAIKKGGILGGHDYATVKAAIDKCFQGQEVHQGADLTWWVYV